MLFCLIGALTALAVLSRFHNREIGMVDAAATEKIPG
jgi:hypothetical protein